MANNWSRVTAFGEVPAGHTLARLTPQPVRGPTMAYNWLPHLVRGPTMAYNWLPHLVRGPTMANNCFPQKAKFRHGG